MNKERNPCLRLCIFTFDLRLWAWSSRQLLSLNVVDGSAGMVNSQVMAVRT